jgi:hypothetical protein
VTNPSWKVCNYCNKPGHLALDCWKKKNRNSNFSGNMNRDGNVTTVTRCNRQVLAKTNQCCETATIWNPHDLTKNSHVISARPRPQSVVNCDSPCRNPNERRTAVLADMNVSRAGVLICHRRQMGSKILKSLVMPAVKVADPKLLPGQ